MRTKQQRTLDRKKASRLECRIDRSAEYNFLNDAYQSKVKNVMMCGWMCACVSTATCFLAVKTTSTSWLSNQFSRSVSVFCQLPEHQIGLNAY